MEKRETKDGETVKRENCTAGFGSGGSADSLGADGFSGVLLVATTEEALGNKGKSSSHSKPAPTRQRRMMLMQSFLFEYHRYIFEAIRWLSL